MPTILESGTDITGDDYTDFLDMALDWFAFFSLVWRDTSSFDDSAVQIRRDLDKHETNRRRWVAAVRAGSSLDGIIPVRAEPTREHADMLASRLDFIEEHMIHETTVDNDHDA